MGNLSNNEVKALIECLKFIIHSKKEIYLPPFGEQVQLEATNSDSTIKFLIDINRKGHMNIKKLTLQLRYRYTDVLVRVDFGAKHTNPDGTVLDEPHIHIYEEGNI